MMSLFSSAELTSDARKAAPAPMLRRKMARARSLDRPALLDAILVLATALALAAAIFGTLTP